MEGKELVPVRHPKLQATTPPRYFVSKDAVVYSMGTGKLKPMKKTMEGSHANSYQLTLCKNKHGYLKLEEIMVYTFSEKPYDSDNQYIFHKDGKRENCAWSNLIVCDNLAALQEHEIARLEKLHPEGIKYAVVRNVHDTLTFERYLVSNTGNVYSLIKRDHIRPTEDRNGYLQIGLTCDANAEQTANHYMAFQIHTLVMLSFRGCRPENLRITHINGEKCDNSLENLAYIDPTKKPRKTEGKRRVAPAKEQENERDEIPLPSITKKTKWKTIGTLPWNGLSFSKYEVSNMGHVRKKKNSELLKLCWTSRGYIGVHIRHDNPGLDKRSKLLLVSRLVANAFVDDYNETQNAVTHLNGDRLDNRASNLRWACKQSSSTRRNARPVLASLVDDPKKQKKFGSVNKAQRELSISINLDRLIINHCNYFTTMVNWDGEKKMALIEVFSSLKDKE
ncbi:hypothetical protein BJV82DRAFT_313847 [Fennellomyces sp. T-0311]|nr:hypothetical protein BJV82DRAFT_313847 [Fennellomyces sp. T-0311]